MEIITTHLNADFDGLASMIAAGKLYPEAELAFAGSQEKNLRKFLANSTRVYQFQRQKNIDLAKVTRLILVDTRQPGRIGNFAKCLDNPGLTIHIYDHHPELPGDLKGDYEEIRPVGSTATIFTQLFRERNIEVDRDEATILAMAIYEDTGSFTFSTTTPADLEAMAWLLAKGANLHAVAQFVSQELTGQQVSLLNELMRSAVTYTIEGIDIVVAKINLPEYVDEFALIVRRFMVMENLNCLFSLAAMGEKTYLIARSRIPEVNAGEIALDFGGGGHASAASATVQDMTLIEAEEKLVHLLHKHVRPASIAGEIMSAPVISAPPEITIKEASRIIDRYNITVLPIISEGGKAGGELKGVISQRVLGKAVYHGLGDLPVSEYMTTDFAVLPPTATLADIQELIIGNRQRFIPIVKKGKVLGAITRTDLLSLLVKDPAHLPRHMLEPLNTPSVARQRNLKTLMIENLSRDIVVLLKTIGEVAAENDYTAYAVGGFVRDLLLRKVNLDLDIVIEGDGIKFAEKLAKKLKGQIRTHEKFNTAVVILPNGFKVDIATARLEYYEYPAAMPTVELSSIKLDLYRRDFTINAMAIHLGPETFGTLLDFFNCQNDLKDRRIRILHNLSFVEDPTRILRAIRLEQRMRFAIGKHTERLIKNAVKMNLFASITGTAGILKPNSRTRLGFRIFNELKLILSEQEPLPAIKRLGGFQLLKLFHQAMKLDPPLEEILTDTQQAVDWYRLLYQEEPFRPWIVFMLALTCRLTSRQLNTLYRRLEIPDRYVDLLLAEKNQADRLLRTLKKHPAPKPSETYRLMSRLRLEGLVFLMGYAKKDETRKALSNFITYQRHVKTSVTGSDLKELGYAEGPIYGRILERLLYARLDNEVDSREAELTFLKRHYPPGRYRTGARLQARKKP
ncbi:MAG: CBS domain-containing protein [Desulfurivibrionaceae bacterium]|nr:CBS domain-containing protein [Desulfurivibrionaceae bacterium]